MTAPTQSRRAGIVRGTHGTSRRKATATIFFGTETPPIRHSGAAPATEGTMTEVAVTLDAGDLGEALVSRVWATLRASPYGMRTKLWAQACVCIAPESKRVVHRLELAAELEHHDLHALAVEARRRKVPPGSVLAYLATDEFTGFVIVALVSKP
jgi:hypothetical protein